MSRNKTIKLLHEVTLKSYAECRAALKLNHWDFVTTYYYMNGGIDLNEFSKAFANFAENLKQAMAAVCEGLSHVSDIVADSMRERSERLRALAKPFDINKGVFNYSDTVTASIHHPSEVRANCIAEDLKIEEMREIAGMRDQFKPPAIDEIREQFGLQPIDVNDPKTPVFAPYYASKAKDGKLCQNDDKGI